MKKIVIAIAIGVFIIAGIIVCGQIFTVKYVDVKFENSVTSTDEHTILSLVNIDSNTNIFVLDEDEIKKNIEKGFEDNIIKVDDIIREFPNRVTIKVSERGALFKIKAENNDLSGYVSADRNFQRNKIYSQSDLSAKLLIEVEGVTIRNTYQIAECYCLRDIANVLLTYGLKEEALVYFIKSIIFDNNIITINLRSTETQFIINRETFPDTKSAIKSMYEEYISLSPDMRDNAVIYPKNIV